MNNLLMRLPHKRAIGLYIDDSRLVLCRVALTVAGPKLIDCRSEPIEDGKLGAALGRLVEPIATSRGWRSAPLVVGLSLIGVFFSTRPIKTKNRDASPQVLLHEILRSASLNIDDMEVDMIKRQPGKQVVASIVACRKKQLGPILDGLEECSIRPYQIEPAACGLLRLALHRHRTPRKFKASLRIFLGRTGVQAILTTADFPVMWRTGVLEPGAEALNVLSLYRCIEKLARFAGVDAPDAVMIHGRPDLTGITQDPGWADVAIPVSRFDDPGLSPEEIALGLAMGSRDPVESFNLARDLRPPTPIVDLIPWGQLAVQGCAAAVGGLLLLAHLSDLDVASKNLASEMTAIPWLKSQSMSTLQAEQRDLTTRFEVVRNFVGNKISWSTCLREVAERLPAEMTLSNVEGRCDYRPDPKGKEDPRQSKRSLTMSIDAPIPKGMAIPPEVEGVIGTLRESPPLKRILPTVELGTLRWGAKGSAKAASATFTVLCLPPTVRPEAAKSAANKNGSKPKKAP